MRIAFRPIPSAVGWFRGVGPLSYLTDRGHEVVIAERATMRAGSAFRAGLSDDEIREAVRTSDVVLVLGAGSIKGTPFEHAPREFHERRGVLVVDLDDDLWAWSKDPARTIGTGTHFDASELPSVESWIRGADLVTTTTDYLAGVLRSHGARHVAVLPNALDLAFQRRAVATRDNRAARRQAARELSATSARPRRVIGWSGSQAHIEDLAPVLMATRAILESPIDMGVEVRSLGPVNWLTRPEWKGIRAPGVAVPIENVDRLVGPRYKAVLTGPYPPDGAYSWIAPFEVYFDVIEAMAPTVAVVPLRPSALNLSKSPVTLLSWGVQGVPAVCSRVGPYAVAERDGFPARYVPHDDEAAWRSAIEELLYDPIAALELGARAKQWVLDHAAFPLAAARWERAYTEALERKGRGAHAA